MATKQTVTIQFNAKGARVVTRQVNGLTNSMQKAGMKAVSMAAALAGVGLAARAMGRTLVQAEEAYISLQNRSKVFADTQDSARFKMEDVIRIARKMNSSLNEVGEVYQRISMVQQGAGFGDETTSIMVENLAKAVKLSGATAQEAEGALRQFAQGLAANRLSGQELNSVLEQTPMIAKILADSLNVSTGALRQMGKDGELTAKVLVDAFGKSIPDLEEKFAKFQFSIATQFVSLRREIDLTVGQFAKLSGAADILAVPLGAVNSLLSTMQDIMAEATSGSNSILDTGGASNALAKILVYLAATISGVVAALSALAAAFLATKLATFALSGAFAALNVVMLANPWIAAAAGIAAVVGGMWALVSAIKAVNEEEEKLNPKAALEAARKKLERVQNTYSPMEVSRAMTRDGYEPKHTERQLENIKYLEEEVKRLEKVVADADLSLGRKLIRDENRVKSFFSAMRGEMSMDQYGRFLDSGQSPQKIIDDAAAVRQEANAKALDIAFKGDDLAEAASKYAKTMKEILDLEKQGADASTVKLARENAHQQLLEKVVELRDDEIDKISEASDMAIAEIDAEIKAIEEKAALQKTIAEEMRDYANYGNEEARIRTQTARAMEALKAAYEQTNQTAKDRILYEQAVAGVLREQKDLLDAMYDDYEPQGPGMDPVGDLEKARGLQERMDPMVAIENAYQEDKGTLEAGIRATTDPDEIEKFKELLELRRQDYEMDLLKQEHMENMITLNENFRDSSLTMGEAVSGVWSSIQMGLKSVVDQVLNISGHIQQLTTMAINGLATELTNLAKTGDMNIKKMARSFVDAILQITMKLIVLMGIVLALSAIPGGAAVLQLMGMGAAGGAEKAAAPAAGGFGDNFFSGALMQPGTGPLGPPRAAGGPVYGGEPILVGERGPELFVPPVSGSIKNNSATMGMQQQAPQVTVVNVDSTQNTLDALGSEEGEQIIMNVIQRNPEVLRTIG